MQDSLSSLGFHKIEIELYKEVSAIVKIHLVKVKEGKMALRELPNNKEAEMSVLGSCFLSTAAAL